MPVFRSGVKFRAMDRVLEASVVIVAVVGFVGWLGGGRKWAFRAMTATAILLALGAGGVLLYSYQADRVAEHRLQKIHSWVIAKVATAKCTARTPRDSALQKGAVVTTKGDTPWTDYNQHPNEVIWDVCPPYWLPDAPTSEQENAAIAAAEEECSGEIDPKQKSAHDQIVQYRQEHGIAQDANKVKTTDGASVQHDRWEKFAVKTLNTKDCAAKVRTFYPGAYDDLDDATLAKKVLAKYPTYCDVTKAPPAFIPDIKDIR
jgi:hypothetical protein